jgi:hypothetical protein
LCFRFVNLSLIDAVLLVVVQGGAETREDEGWSRRQFSRIWGPMPSAYDLDLQREAGAEEEGDDGAKDSRGVGAAAGEGFTSAAPKDEGSSVARVGVKVTAETDSVPKISSLLASYRSSKALPRIAGRGNTVCYIGRHKMM